VSDAVGVFCFRPVGDNTPTQYRAESVPAHVSLDRVLFRACQDLTALKNSRPLIAPTPGPAELAEEIAIDEGDDADGS